MRSSDKKRFRRSGLIWVIIALVAVAGIYLRFVALDSDPPMYFSGHGQSLSTDPHQYTYFSRNKLMFDRWEMFDSAKWRVFEVSVISGFSYLLFSLFGISRYIANLTGLLLSLLSIFIFLLTLRKFVNPSGILLVLVLLLFNKVLFVYGRLPYLENGMIFLMSIIFFIFVFYRQHLWGKIVIGVLIALAGLAGKVFGYLLIVPVVISYCCENRRRRLADISTVLASCGVATVVWLLIAYGGDLKLLLGYYQEQSVGLYGFPDAFKSPFAFFERLISFGNDSRFYWNAAVIGVAGFIAFYLLLSSRTKVKLRDNIPLFFLIIWFAAGQLIFMPENYRPVRYIYMLYFPLAGIAGFVFSRSGRSAKEASLKPSYFRYALSFILFWILLEQLIFSGFFNNRFVDMHKKVVWITALPAFAIALAEMKFGFMRFLARSRVYPVLSVLIILSAFANFGFSYLKWEKQKSFNIMDAGEDLQQVLNDDAVICGPIAPTFLIENDLKGMIYAVGISDTDKDFFRRHPVTHFAIDADASGLITDRFPELTAARTVAEYWIRDTKVIVVRISDLTGNRISGEYVPTEYEIGRHFMEKKVFDSALYYMERFAAQYHENKSVLRVLGELYPVNGQIDRAMPVLQKAVALYSYDFSILMGQATYYHKRYVATGERQFLYLAREAYESVSEKNPYRADEVAEMARKIALFKGKSN